MPLSGRQNISNNFIFNGPFQSNLRQANDQSRCAGVRSSNHGFNSAIPLWKLTAEKAMAANLALLRRIDEGSKPLTHLVRNWARQKFSTSVTPATPALAALRERLANGGPSLADFISQNPQDAYSVEVGSKKNPLPKPKWMKASVPGGEKYTAIKTKLRELKLHTVCEEARCPNLAECWSGGETGTATATIMILGDTCTRGCRFCAVKTSRNPPPPDPDEPTNVAEAIVSWGLDYVVLTSVDRDDLPDQGSGHFAETVSKLKELKPQMLVEALVPDFQGNSECVQKVATSGLDVFAHNIETVEELQTVVRDRRANFKQSLEVLKMAKSFAPPGTLTKTSIMLGCGETPAQVIKTMENVRKAGVDVMTFGQYMRPTKRHMPVSEYVTPEAFDDYQNLGMEMGFRYVASGPMEIQGSQMPQPAVEPLVNDTSWPVKDVS
ncbi:hypothetical protein SUGI_0528560 [Cryptomeria japonica]|nr:hypothetical protein SUGI_0528560 [Cryptomeria japonica]